MSKLDIFHVVHVAFFVGPKSEGATIGENTSFLANGCGPILPEVGKTFAWKDNSTGARYSGTVASAGAGEFLLTSGQVTVNVQINCVNSFRL